VGVYGKLTALICYEDNCVLHFFDEVVAAEVSSKMYSDRMADNVT
jgi:hypothetical protein